jgi:hypothetical protein
MAFSESRTHVAQTPPGIVKGLRGGLLALLGYALATCTAWLFYKYAPMACFLPALFLAGMSVPGLVIAFLATQILHLPKFPISVVVVVSSLVWLVFGFIISRSSLPNPSKLALSALSFVALGFTLLGGYLVLWMVAGPR